MIVPGLPNPGLPMPTPLPSAPPPALLPRLLTGFPPPPSLLPVPGVTAFCCTDWIGCRGGTVFCCVGWGCRRGGWLAQDCAAWSWAYNCAWTGAGIWFEFVAGWTIVCTVD